VGEFGGSAPEIVIGTIAHKSRINEPVQTAEFVKAAIAEEQGVNTTEILDTYQAAEVLTPEQRQQVQEGIEKAKQVLAKVPDDFTEEQKIKSVELLNERTEIEQSIEGKDEALIGPQIQRQEEINAELKSIAEPKPVEEEVSQIETPTGTDTEVVVSESESNKTVPTPEIPLSEQKRENKQVEDGLNEQGGVDKSDSAIEKRMAEIEGAGFGTPELAEFNALEKEMEKRERDSVFNVPLENVNDAIGALINKEKEQPNGYGSFIEKRDARETKEVADRYLNAKDLTEDELKKDFSDAVRGNPTTWYADGLKLREALKEATNRGIDTKGNVS
jgi:hypothetical protein